MPPLFDSHFSNDFVRLIFYTLHTKHVFHENTLWPQAFFSGSDQNDSDSSLT